MRASQQREYSMWAQRCLFQAPKPAISADELHLPESKQSVPYVISECPQQWSQFTVGDLHPSTVCLASWLYMHHQSWCCEWDPVSLWRIMSSVVNLAVFLWIMPHSETATVPVPCLFLCEFTEAVVCVCTQIFLCFPFCFGFLTWLNFMVWPKCYTWFSLPFVWQGVGGEG